MVGFEGHGEGVGVDGRRERHQMGGIHRRHPMIGYKNIIDGQVQGVYHVDELGYGVVDQMDGGADPAQASGPYLCSAWSTSGK